MGFEYDPHKSAANKHKHGIDFEEAQALWEDVKCMEIPACAEPEKRWMVTGRIGHACWTAIVTHRGDGIRIISVRRARKEEEIRYEEDHSH